MAQPATVRSGARRTARPRAGERRPARGAIRWHRVGRLALLGTLAAIVLLYIPPITHWVQQRGTQSRSEADLRRVQAEHQRLATRLEALSAPGGIERAARALGMVRRGERAYVVVGPLPH